MYINAINEDTGIPRFIVPDEGELDYEAKISVETLRND